MDAELDTVQPTSPNRSRGWLEAGRWCVEAMRPMVICLVSGSLLSVSTATFAAGGNKDKVVRAEDVDPKVVAIIDKYRASIPKMMDEPKVPGLAIALLFGGKRIWAEGFGVTDTTSNHPVTPETIFSVQSISKTYTATAVMAAVAEGRVALDEPITTYLPSFTVHSRFEDDPQKKITLRLLLSHHAGFTHEAPVGNNHDDDTRSFDAHLKSISDTWLIFPVGQRYSYSNLGIDIAGHILEVVYQKPFSKVMAQKVFRPLGLKSTTVDQDAIEQSKTRAVGHTRDHDRVPVRIAMIPAGGGLHERHGHDALHAVSPERRDCWSENGDCQERAGWHVRAVLPG